MGGRKQKYNKIEPIIATLNLFIKVFIYLFLVLSFLNSRRQMITQYNIVIQQVSQTQIKLYFITSYISRLQNEPIFEI